MNGITRRTMIGSSVAAGATAVVSPGWHPWPAAATTPTGRLVVVFLRGAADHLSITVPLDEATYHDRRPTIAVDEDATLPLDDHFGMHPALARLHERFVDGQLAPVVAVGNPAADRSHFLGQDLLERGSDGDDRLGDGWLARHLRTTADDDGPLRAVTMDTTIDESLLGYPALGMGSLASFGLVGAGDRADHVAAGLGALYTRTSLGDLADQALASIESVDALPASTDRDPTKARFADIATLFEADLGTEVVTVNLGGWDTHDAMGDAGEGQMHDLLVRLDRLLGDFADDLDRRGLDDVTTLVVTEFGRRVAENGAGGCEHGWGSAALLLGRRVAGGSVHGAWPGLDRDVVDDARGDVPMATDFRDVFGDVVEHVLDGDPTAVFPDHDRTALGLFA